jgi:hypothetical protein
VSVSLNPRAFAYYDTAGKDWHADADQYSVEVGRSSAETPLHADITLTTAYDIANDK